MKKLALAIGVAVAICGTALAASTAYQPGTYTGMTHQSQHIAMDVPGQSDGQPTGQMSKLDYTANFRCTDKQGQHSTLSNHVTKLGPAKIKANQVNAVYHLNGGDQVHLHVALDDQKTIPASGWFTEALSVHHAGHTYKCVTPGGHAGKAGKVSFTMKWSSGSSSQGGSGDYDVGQMPYGGASNFSYVLDTQSGYALYVFCNANESCTQGATNSQFPPLVLSHAPIGGPGVVQSALSTTTINGQKVVTYYGQPLYRYKGDTAPGQTNGLAYPTGDNGEWDLMQTSGFAWTGGA